MALPSLDQRSTSDLVEQKKKLTETRDKVADIAHDLGMEPYFAAPIRRIDEACEAIDQEIARR